MYLYSFHSDIQICISRKWLLEFLFTLTTIGDSLLINIYLWGPSWNFFISALPYHAGSLFDREPFNNAPNHYKWKLSPRTLTNILVELFSDVLGWVLLRVLKVISPVRKHSPIDRTLARSLIIHSYSPSMYLIFFSERRCFPYDRVLSSPERFVLVCWVCIATVSYVFFYVNPKAFPSCCLESWWVPAGRDHSQ